MDQRNNISNGIKSRKVFKMLNIAFGESTVNKTGVCKWYKHFQEGC